MHIDEHGRRVYSSTDEGRQYVDAIENAGLDEEYRRQQQEMEAMTTPPDVRDQSRRDYWQAREWGLPDDAAQRYAEACRLGRLFDCERSQRESEGTAYRKEIAGLREAIACGGLVLAPCRMCSCMVACIPDGLPYCERCAAKEAARQA